MACVRTSVNLLAAACALLSLAACSDALPTYVLTGAAMGTSYSVKIVGAPRAGERLRAHIENALVTIEDSMSTYRPDSELSRFNSFATTSWFEVSRELCDVVAAARRISVLSGGAFDVTVGPLVNLWGFGPDGMVDEPPDAELIAAARERVGYDRLHADCSIPALRKDVGDLYVDLSAYAKGFAVDRVALLLDDAGVANYLVEIGGEMRMRGVNARRDKWSIAIETPEPGGRSVQTIVGLSDAAMATSGDYRNFFEHAGTVYSHTIDPRTGFPVAHGAASVTVVAETAAFADGIATALLVLGPADGMDMAEREGIAAYFLLRIGDGIGDGIAERMSTLFAREVMAR